MLGTASLPARAVDDRGNIEARRRADPVTITPAD